jgi:hypothetical protein
MIIGICIDNAIWAHSASLLDCFIFLLMMGASCLYFILAIIAVSAVADAWRLERRPSWTIVLLGVLYAILPIVLAALAT